MVVFDKSNHLVIFCLPLFVLRHTFFFSNNASNTHTLHDKECGCR